MDRHSLHIRGELEANTLVAAQKDIFIVEGHVVGDIDVRHKYFRDLPGWDQRCFHKSLLK
jgi:hypothetical protein